MLRVQESIYSFRLNAFEELSVACARSDTTDVSGAIEAKPVGTIVARRLRPNGDARTAGSRDTANVHVGEPGASKKHPWRRFEAKSECLGFSRSCSRANFYAQEGEGQSKKDVGQGARIHVHEERHRQTEVHTTHPNDRAREGGSERTYGPRNRDTIIYIEQCWRAPPKGLTRSKECS